MLVLPKTLLKVLREFDSIKISIKITASQGQSPRQNGGRYVLIIKINTFSPKISSRSVSKGPHMFFSILCPFVPLGLALTIPNRPHHLFIDHFRFDMVNLSVPRVH